MKKTLQSYNLIDTLGEAYEAFLVSAQKKAHQSGTAFHLMIDAALGNNATDNTSTKFETSLKNDLGYAPPYNFIDALGEAYEALLESTLRKANGASSVVHQMIDVFFGTSEHDRNSTQPAKYMKHAVVCSTQTPGQDRIGKE